MHADVRGYTQIAAIPIPIIDPSMAKRLWLDTLRYLNNKYLYEDALARDFIKHDTNQDQSGGMTL